MASNPDHVIPNTVKVIPCYTCKASTDKCLPYRCSIVYNKSRDARKPGSESRTKTGLYSHRKGLGLKFWM